MYMTCQIEETAVLEKPSCEVTVSAA